MDGTGAVEAASTAPSVWQTLVTVVPSVAILGGVATRYLRNAITLENAKQKVEMMREIREMFALKEVLSVQLEAVRDRLSHVEQMFASEHKR